MGKIDVTFYTRNGCTLCEKAKNIIQVIIDEFDVSYTEVDISTSDELTEKFGLMIPVLELNGEIVQYGVIDKMFIYKAFTEKLESNIS